MTSCFLSFQPRETSLFWSHWKTLWSKTEQVLREMTPDEGSPISILTAVCAICQSCHLDKGRSPHGPDTIPHFPTTLYSNAQCPGQHARRTPSPRCSLRPWRQGRQHPIGPIASLDPAASSECVLPATKAQYRTTNIGTIKTMAQSHGASPHVP